MNLSDFCQFRTSSEDLTNSKGYKKIGKYFNAMHPIQVISLSITLKTVLMESTQEELSSGL